MNKHLSRAEIAAARPAGGGGERLAGGHIVAPDGTLSLADGSMVISPGQLTRFGDGDITRGRRALRGILAAAPSDAVFVGPTAKPATVRLGLEADEPRILELLLMDLKENAEFIAPIDEKKVLDSIQVGTRLRGGFAGVIEADKQIVAVTIIHPQQWEWSQGWFFADKFTFVHPEHTKSNHVHDLIAFGKWIVDEQTRNFGYRVYFFTGVMGVHRLWTKITLWRRKATQVGAGFLYPSPMGNK